MAKEFILLEMRQGPFRLHAETAFPLESIAAAWRQNLPSGMIQKDSGKNGIINSTLKSDMGSGFTGYFYIPQQQALPSKWQSGSLQLLIKFLP